MADSNADNNRDSEAVNYFLSLKQKYELDRQPWEPRWRQALAAYHVTDNLDTVYEGRANIQIPIMKWKVNGIVARENRILFNVKPFGRIEDTKAESIDKNIVDLWNRYIFDYQLEQIDFKSAFKQFNKNKEIEGTAVAKVTQEFQEKNFSFFDDVEEEQVIVKDNTYFRNMLLTEFYSDVSKENINDSQACIHATSVPMAELLANEIRREEVEIETEDGIIIESQEFGFYKNLDLLQLDGANITEQQAEYIQLLGLNRSETTAFQKSLRDTKKTGFVQIDECYGLFDIDGSGNQVEAVCTIANGRVVIRLEETPFKHKKYVRPFIVGRAEPIGNCLYGNSNIITGLPLLMELNAARAQATDARTRSVSPMWYQDETKNVRWDGTWRPNGIIKGQGQNGMIPLLNPNLSNVSITDSEMISRDLDQLWSLSPVQEGTSDSRFIPDTASGTRQLISQNDMPLNDKIDNTTEMELKPFIEMIYERNLVFKTVEDLLVVWDEKDLAKAKVDENTDMVDLAFDINVSILGNLELSNEIAQQNGWNSFLNFAMNVPPIASRLDWQAVADKQLKAFGIKDDAEGIWLDDADVLAAQQEAQQAAVQGAQFEESQAQKGRAEAKEDAKFIKELDTESDIVKMQSEAIIEKTTGQKIQ